MKKETGGGITTGSVIWVSVFFLLLNMFCLSAPTAALAANATLVLTADVIDEDWEYLKEPGGDMEITITLDKSHKDDDGIRNQLNKAWKKMQVQVKKDIADLANEIEPKIKALEQETDSKSAEKKKNALQKTLNKKYNRIKKDAKLKIQDKLAKILFKEGVYKDLKTAKKNIKSKSFGQKFLALLPNLATKLAGGEEAFTRSWTFKHDLVTADVDFLEEPLGEFEYTITVFFTGKVDTIIMHLPYVNKSIKTKLDTRREYMDAQVEKTRKQIADDPENAEKYTKELNKLYKKTMKAAQLHVDKTVKKELKALDKRSKALTIKNVKHAYKIFGAAFKLIKGAVSAITSAADKNAGGALSGAFASAQGAVGLWKEIRNALKDELGPVAENMAKALSNFTASGYTSNLEKNMNNCHTEYVAYLAELRKLEKKALKIPKKNKELAGKIKLLDKKTQKEEIKELGILRAKGIIQQDKVVKFVREGIKRGKETKKILSQVLKKLKALKKRKIDKFGQAGDKDYDFYVKADSLTEDLSSKTRLAANKMFASVDGFFDGIKDSFTGR